MADESLRSEKPHPREKPMSVTDKMNAAGEKMRTFLNAKIDKPPVSIINEIHGNIIPLLRQDKKNHEIAEYIDGHLMGALRVAAYGTAMQEVFEPTGSDFAKADALIVMLGRAKEAIIHSDVDTYPISTTNARGRACHMIDTITALYPTDGVQRSLYSV